MLKTIAVTSGILLGSLGPVEESVKQDDPYVRCSSYHWAVVNHARDMQDLYRMREHLARLSELAGRMGTERRLSRDAAHSILRREAEVILSASGAGASEQAMFRTDDGGCAPLSRRITK